MIVFDLRCSTGHVFEAWFGSTGDFDAQVARGLVACPICDDNAVTKAAMAPAVPSKSNQGASPSQIKAALGALAAVQAKVEASSDYVGPAFATEARAMHDGDTPSRSIYGEATRAEAAALVADGVPIAALPFRSKARADA
jgi:hypothetical protein